MNDIEKAIEILKEHYKDATMFLTSRECKEYNKAIDLAILTLEEKLDDGWIPVSERLPEEDEEVLITLAHGCVCWAFIYLNEWNTATTSYPIECAIAWMPLPEPYKRD